MMIVMKEGATQAEVDAVVRRVESVGAHAHISAGELVTVIGAIGDREHVANLGLEGAPGVDHLVPILKPYKLASLQYRRGERTVLEIDGRRIGGEHFATIAGPCTVESREVLLDAARTVRDAGAQFLRGGAYKPRTSPVLVPGPGRGGAAPAGRGEGRDRPADRDRADGRARSRAGARGGRRGPARRAQHAELHAAHRGGPRRQAGAAEARACRPRSRSC